MEGAQSMDVREPSPSSEVLEKPVRRRLTVIIRGFSPGCFSNAC